MSALPSITQRAIKTVNQALRQEGRFEQYKNIHTKVILYLSLIGWLLKDLCVAFPLRVLKVTFFHTVGVTSGTAVIGFIFLYSRQIASGKPISFYKIALPSVQGPSSIKIALLITILGCAATLCSYLSEWAIVRLAVDYQCRCQDRLFTLLMNEKYRGWAYFLNGPAKKEVLKLQQQTLFIGRIIRVLLRSVWPTLIFLISISSLIIIDLNFTLILLPVCLIYSMPLYAANMYAVRSKSKYQEKNIYAKGKIRELVESIVNGSHTKKESRIETEIIIQDPSYRQAGNLSFQRLLVSLHTELLNTIFLIIGVFLLFSFAAFQSQNPNWSWPQFILYLLSFRFAIAGLKKITAIIISISRLIPDFRNHVEFLWNIKNFDSSATGVQDVNTITNKNFSIRTFPSKVINNNKKINLHTQQILWIVLPYSAQTADIEGIATLLSRRVTPKVNILKHCDFFIGNRTRDIETISQISRLSLPDKHRLISELKLSGLYQEVRNKLEMCFQKELTSFRELTEKQKWILKTYQLLLSEKEIVFLNTTHIRKQTELLDKIVNGSRKSQTLVLVTKDLDEAECVSGCLNGETNISYLILNNKNKVVSCGGREWTIYNKEAIIQVLNNEKIENNVDLLDLEEEEI